MKQVGVNIIISLLSACLAIILIEALLRVYTYPLYPYGQNSCELKEGRNTICDYDPVLGWKIRPNTKAINICDEYATLEYFNSKGVRGPEYPYAKDEDEYRILIIGDSFAEGWTVNFDDLFSEILKRNLNTALNRHFEVINAGVRGYSTDQELLFFQNEGKKYNPDLVIVIFYDNDVWYNGRPLFFGTDKPLFRLENGILSLTNVPVPRPDEYKTEDRVETRSVKGKDSKLEKIRQWLDRHSYLYRALRKRVKSVYCIHSLAIKLRLTALQKADDYNTSYNKNVSFPSEYNAYKKAYSDDIARSWKITEALLVQLNKETIAAGGRLLVVYTPSRACIYPKEWQSVKRRCGFSDKDWDAGQIGAELSSICRKNSISLIDTMKLFKFKTHKLKQQLYSRGTDNHLNRNGHRFLGDIISQYIISNLKMK